MDAFHLNSNWPGSPFNSGMNGEEVLLFYTTDEKIRDAILSVKDPMIATSFVQFVLKATGTKTNYRPGRMVDDDFFSDARPVFNLNWKNPAKSDDFVISFFLTKDHHLGSSTPFFLIDDIRDEVLYSTKLMSQSIQRKEVTNRNARRLSRPFNPSVNQPFTVRCQESKEEYKLVIDKPRNSLQGIFYISIF